VRDSEHLEYASFRPLTSILSPAPGERRENRMRFGGMSAGFIKVREMDLIALLLTRPFHSGVC